MLNFNIVRLEQISVSTVRSGTSSNFCDKPPYGVLACRESTNMTEITHVNRQKLDNTPPYKIASSGEKDNITSHG